MRISSIQYSGVKYVKNTPKIKENKTVTVPQKTVTSIRQPYFYVNFGSINDNKSTDPHLYKDLTSILNAEMLKVKEELSLMPVNMAMPDNPSNEPNIDLSNLSLKQRNIVKKYATSSALKKLLEMEKEGSSNEIIIQNILAKEVNLINKYNSLTFKKFTDNNSTKEEKLESFSTAMFFLGETMKRATNEELKEILSAVVDFKDSVNSMEMLLSDDCYEKTKKLFELSENYWRKYNLTELMEEQFKKMIYTEEITNNYLKLQNSKTYTCLPSDEKYFVAKYIENQKNDLKEDDPILEILSNRTIPDIPAVIKEMSNKISTDEEIFYYVINNSYDFIRSKDGIEKLKELNLCGKNQDDDINLHDMYLLFFERTDLIAKSDDEKVLDFFKTISNEELNKANEEIVKEWFDNYLPAKLDKEVMFKAHETDVNTQIIKELKQINENLGNLTIKLDEMTIPLSEVVSNMDRMYAKLDNNPEKTQRLQESSSMYLEAMKNGFSQMTPEQCKQIMKTLKNDGIAYLNTLETKTSDPQSRAIISGMKQTIVKANNPMSVVTKLEGYAPIPILNRGIAIIQKGIRNSNIKASVDNMVSQGINEEQALTLAKNNALKGELPMAPVSIAKIGCWSALAAGLYGIYKASNVHQQFSDLYFGE